MREKVESMMWNCKVYMESTVENFLMNEEGDSNMVAVIVLIVIVIAVGAVFRDNLEDAVDAVFSKLTGFIEQ